MNYKVLIIAKTLAELLVRLVNQNEEFEAKGISSLDEFTMSKLGDFDIILIGGGIDDKDITIVKELILINKLNTRLIEHFGGGSGLLLQELYDAINKEK